ncbi:hypothetical protein Taro_043884 [Colocasia esculenta]|uniref:Uncharacterized protein n=1 Tax=Colocasia esculenta TaxID=4460 RepID=A0A843X1K8_COLES|nr:hypothetical protein [Colocasia esculenta]
MSPSGLLKATGPMSPSHVQNLKCPSREHKPQFVSLLGEGFSSGELRLGDSVGGLGGRPWCFFARKGNYPARGRRFVERRSSEVEGETSQQFPPRRSEETGPQ